MPLFYTQVSQVSVDDSDSDTEGGSYESYGEDASYGGGAGAAAGGGGGGGGSAAEEQPMALLLCRLADRARHRIVVAKEWHFEFSGGRHFDRLAPRLQVCVMGDWLRRFVVELPAARHASALCGRRFWDDAVVHALLRSLHPLLHARPHPRLRLLRAGRRRLRGRPDRGPDHGRHAVRPSLRPR